MTSQYQISKARKELKRLEAELASAQAKQDDLVARGLNGSAEEAGWRVHDLQVSVSDLAAWIEASKATKFEGWAPARLQRHQQRHSA